MCVRAVPCTGEHSLAESGCGKHTASDPSLDPFPVSFEICQENPISWLQTWGPGHRKEELPLRSALTPSPGHLSQQAWRAGLTTSGASGGSRVRAGTVVCGAWAPGHCTLPHQLCGIRLPPHPGLHFPCCKRMGTLPAP